MIRTAAISPEHRANLRHLRATFEAAYEAMDDPSDRSSLQYVEADRCYRVWIRAMDEVAMALLDDIDSLEAAARDMASRPSDIVPRALAMPEMTDRADLFADSIDFEQARELIGAPEEDPTSERLYDGL